MIFLFQFNTIIFNKLSLELTYKTQQYIYTNSIFGIDLFIYLIPIIIIIRIVFIDI